MKKFIFLATLVAIFGSMKSAHAQLRTCDDCTGIRQAAGAPTRLANTCTGNGYSLVGAFVTHTFLVGPCNGQTDVGECTVTASWNQWTCHCPNPAPAGHNIQARSVIMLDRDCTNETQNPPPRTDCG